MDHFVCSNKGRLFTSHCASKEVDMYCGGAICVDQALGYVHLEHQAQLASHDTLRAKERYKAMCCDHGLIPQKYLSDNSSAFATSEYQAHLSSFQQVKRFTGPRVHHHNS